MMPDAIMKSGSRNIEIIPLAFVTGSLVTSKRTTAVEWQEKKDYCQKFKSKQRRNKWRLQGYTTSFRN